ncbi:MAG TPA: exodeoxyribonuclease V subunit beta [Idiomarina abyssalis]|jgi:exodeoxyribonuclease V beta subunit|uniref:exodeoxyribonuclease V subunit beta n=5 Tax=Idiomarinaceae TaxID=267893 RepID=UPI000C398AC9|nr:MULTISPECIES: exodeoxyribonuclease V subunit beta [Idiomarina]MBE93343.1 exodeoxyribonuclease V subunit beta [Idiomarina sp.]MBE93440.1 exodeoxyribonuclease V subunit beta [Idiomarina sp.]MBH93413.1 exodeoxyribonuclease V subunit beta [Idiomarina sp.]HAS14945.1 exodeoxyribonuclease V subunit beta [Idiomarina abyssalis]|tara:strand:+ start:38279 stop:41995 length:3717 start_codon:yes stop_codon:yes gene_type:complete
MSQLSSQSSGHTLENPLDFPLNSSRLIEASAGTGKTYTIAALYVRLVIGHGSHNGTEETAFDRELVPKNILVMTFTKAATEELSDRIRARLAEAAAYFRDPEAVEGDPFLASLRDDCAAQGQNLMHLARLLDLASQSMDEAAVKTIHGWCQSMLKEHAFASGSLFSQDVETDNEELRLQAAEDYFRRFIYPADAELSARLLEDFKSPETLLGLTYSLSKSGQAPVNGDLHSLLKEAESAHQQRMADIKQEVAPIVQELVDKTSQAKGAATKLKQFQKFADWCGDSDLVEPDATAANWKNIGTDELQKFAEAKLGGMPQSWATLGELQERIKRSKVQQQEELAKVKQHAAFWVSSRFAELQNQRAEMGHDDMLTRLRDALKGPSGEALAAAIRKQYPVAMVDEFQDTDPVQYEIFNRIYNLADPHPGTGIFLIGDPKQAIYSFRNADIYTYLKARRDTEGRHYNLARNFRSSQAMVDGVNALFERAEELPRGAFLFKTEAENQLPFNPVGANGLKRTFKHCLLSSNLKTAPALLWSVSGEEKRNKNDFFRAAANHHANLIASLLNDPQAGYYNGDDKLEQRVKTSDIAVLVNNFNEANAIKKALSDRGLKSVYLSDRESVFAQRVAKDLLALVSACAEPRDPSLIRSALATQLLGLPLAELEHIHSHEREWEERVEQFLSYHDQWQRQGVLAMLHSLLHDHQVPAKLLEDRIHGERQLSDVLHIAELLQQQSLVLDGIPALVNHFAEQVNERHGFGSNSRTQSDEQQLRLESDDELIKIITIHKSKGLQYPLVFMPFVAYTQAEAYRIKPPAVYHDENGELQVLWSKDDDNKQRLSNEILAEDLRKMYVAVTRAQYATFIALEAVKEHRNNPLFYLLNGGESLTDELYNEVSERWHQAPHTQLTRLEDDEPLVRALEQEQTTPKLTPRSMPAGRKLERWWVASYSALKYEGAVTKSVQAPQSPDEMNLLDERDDPDETEVASAAEPSPDSIHHLPKGAGPGTFLHNLLEESANIGFAKIAGDAAERTGLVEGFCVSPYWQEHQNSLEHWLDAYLHNEFSINGSGDRVSLSALEQYKAEPEFWFGASEVNAQRLDALVREHILPGHERPALEPNVLNGMLKGFIDLVFEHNGKYYVADYKSNWLGEDDHAYTEQAMREKILHSRYDLQYVIYTLALHRLLKARLGSEYDYDTHVGGAVYLFLRGHRAESDGAFCDRPPRELIEKLDALFSGKDLSDKEPV